MTLEIKSSVTLGAGAVSASLKLPEGVPQISLSDVEAVVRRSKSAARMKAEFDDRLGCHGVFSRHEVQDLVKRAGGTGKHAEPNQAVVLAYFAQRHAEVFAPDAHQVVAQFLGDVDWKTLMADLKDFIADLKEKEAEHARAEQLKKQMLADDIKHDDQKRDLLKQNGTADERKREVQKVETQKASQKKQIREASPADLDDELTGSGRVPMSDVELAKLALLKKGFANRD